MQTPVARYRIPRFDHASEAWKIPIRSKLPCSVPTGWLVVARYRIAIRAIRRRADCLLTINQPTRPSDENFARRASQGSDEILGPSRSPPAGQSAARAAQTGANSYFAWGCFRYFGFDPAKHSRSDTMPGPGHEGVSTQSHKYSDSQNILIYRNANQRYIHDHPVPLRGALRERQQRGAGCGDRGGCF